MHVLSGVYASLCMHLPVAERGPTSKSNGLPLASGTGSYNLYKLYKLDPCVPNVYFCEVAAIANMLNEQLAMVGA